MNISISIDGAQLAFAEEDEAGEAVEEEVPNPVIPEMNEVLWAAGSFFVLWALMRYVLLPPLLRLRSDREDKVASEREAADRATAALGEVQQEYDAALADARSEADGIIDAARAEAAEHRAEVLGAANADIAELRTAAASELDDSRVEALRSMRNDIGDIAVTAASAVLDRDLDRNANQAAIDAALSGGDA